MFKKRKGMSTGAMIAASTAIIALFSPLLRRRLSSMTQMNLSSMMKGKDQHQHESSRHESHSHSRKDSKGTAEVGQMIKQAFTAVQPNETSQHQTSSKNYQSHQPRESYAQSLHIDESVMNVMDDESIQQVLNDIEHN
ncbi:spore coat protein [Bacillus altitudinis]|uniref:spore coat protein n=1 Tax=Bacillus altitudinis TaxID=293387 RepID=UPI000C25104F|nr:spore coat protein [Bacillus altitudinis]MDF9416457.1 spore coat protein [Bacillus altitudinis]MEE3606496.1 spore coat protein [Bacillus altitudinis]MEE3612795.1 spore coat protein [Bacillus altitudinis]MEE3647743.1 spore coat protein [Bacillus altitudinis]MEE4392656.1 spore coat protein [Bacillus altitudinis]